MAGMALFAWQREPRVKKNKNWMCHLDRVPVFKVRLALDGCIQLTPICLAGGFADPISSGTT